MRVLLMTGAMICVAYAAIAVDRQAGAVIDEVTSYPSNGAEPAQRISVEADTKEVAS